MNKHIQFRSFFSIFLLLAFAFSFGSPALAFDTTQHFSTPLGFTQTVLITHDPELIYKCCTYLLFIQGSKVLWHRPMDDEAVKLLQDFFSHEKEVVVINASL